MIRAILFDLGKVIVPFDFGIGYKGLQNYTGLQPEKIREVIRHTGLVNQFETGLIESRSFVKQLREALDVDIAYDDFCDIWSSIFSPNTLISEEFIRSLSQRYPLVLVSNTNAIHFEMIKACYPLLRHFKAYVLSYKVQAMKPDPKIYQAAIEAAGCRASECFFTDDIPDYVEGAKAVGIDAVIFEGEADLAKNLNARGVNC